jgi:hypothetical protein
MSLESGPRNEKVPSTEALQKLILTPKEYSEHFWVTSPERTRVYSYELAKGSKRLTMLGVPHVHNPDDPLYPYISEHMSYHKPDLVLVEGMEGIEDQKERVTNTVLGMSDTEARMLGENMYALKQALEAQIDFESPEPSLAAQTEFLVREGFSKRDIVLHYLTRQLEQYYRSDAEAFASQKSEFIDKTLHQLETRSGILPQEFARLQTEVREDIAKVIETTMKERIDPMPREGRVDTVGNEISSVLTQYRDSYILTRIISALKKHDRIMVVYGSGHAVTLEPALRALMG